jgi:hypothetical protein
MRITPGTSRGPIRTCILRVICPCRIERKVITRLFTRARNLQVLLAGWLFRSNHRAARTHSEPLKHIKTRIRARRRAVDPTKLHTRNNSRVSPDDIPVLSTQCQLSNMATASRVHETLITYPPRRWHKHRSRRRTELDNRALQPSRLL